jgi:hypothetical protein
MSPLEAAAVGDPARGVEERLRQIEDRQAILERLATYGRAIDDGLTEAFADCWTADAILEFAPSPHRELRFRSRRFSGRAAIMRDFFAVHTHAPELFHKHLIYQPQIVLDGDRATVRSDFERVDESPSGPVVRSFGRYDDELVRCDDGDWRFASRHGEVESSSSISSSV